VEYPGQTARTNNTIKKEHDMTEVLAVMIPIIAIVMGIGLGMLALYFKHRQRDMIHRERLAALEKGIEPPPLPEAFLEEKRLVTPGTYLLKGLVWLFIGLGLVLALARTDHGPDKTWGLLPAGIGLAYLVFFYYEQYRHNASQAK
jgi:hypothetical protein